MKAGIITIKGREQMIDNLISLIRPKVDEVKVFVDTERRGHWYNLHRCMEEILGKAGKDEPILITCDDVETVFDWRERWEKIHSQAKNTIYTMMTRQRHLFTNENIERGYITKCQARGFYDHAVIYINQQNLIPRVMRWFESTGKNKIPIMRQKHFDVIIQEYLIDNNIPWTITIPTLFNHIGDKSSLGHNIGGSPLYIGDQNENV